MQEKEINVSRENKRVRSRLTKIPYTPPLSSPTVKISPLTEEALEQICLYARIAKKRLRRSTLFISP